MYFNLLSAVFELWQWSMKLRASFKRCLRIVQAMLSHCSSDAFALFKRCLRIVQAMPSHCSSDAFALFKQIVLIFLTHRSSDAFALLKQIVLFFLITQVNHFRVNWFLNINIVNRQITYKAVTSFFK